MPLPCASPAQGMRRANPCRAASSMIMSLCLGATAGVAQEALRESLAGEKAAAARRGAIEHQSYNLQTGPVRLALGTSLGIELNDNVRYTGTDTAEDVILEPRVNTRLFWRVTEANALSASIGLGYRKYSFHN